MSNQNDHAAEDRTILELLTLVRIRVRHRLKTFTRDHVDDVEQECVLKLLRIVRDPERLGSIRKLKAYAQRVIDFAINDAIRDHERNRRLVKLASEIPAQVDGPTSKDNPVDVAADNELAAGLHLTRKQQLLFDLRRKLGSTAAVAGAMNISSQTASERLCRLFRKLKQQRHAIEAA